MVVTMASMMVGWKDRSSVVKMAEMLAVEENYISKFNTRLNIKNSTFVSITILFSYRFQ